MDDDSRTVMSLPVRIGFGLCFLLYPVLLLTVKGGMNAVFFLTCIFSVIWLFRSPPPIRSRFDRDAIFFAAAMASSVAAVLLSQIGNWDFAPHAFDAPSRLVLAILVFISLKNANQHIFVPLQYAFPLGALAAGYVVMASDHARATAPFIDSIHFGDLALLLGFLSILSIRWTHKDSYWLIALKIIGLIVGGYVSIQSGQRGGWVAIPFVFLVWFLLQDMQHKARWFLLGTLLLFGFMATMYFFIPIVHSRIDATCHELVNFWHGREFDTSAGVRLQQWQGAWQIFVQNPWFGVGADNVGQAMIPFERSGMISKRAASEALGELHNDIFSYTARFGLLGLLSIFSLYLVPLTIFVRTSSGDSAFQRTTGIMGACFVAAFFAFGLTVENFNLKMVVAFYAMTVAILLAAATSPKEE